MVGMWIGTGWHWLVSFLGSVVLWCFLAAIVLGIVELCLYRRRKRRDRR